MLSIVGSPTYVLSPTGRFKTVCDRIGPSHDITFRKATYEEGKLLENRLKNFRMSAALKNVSAP